MIPSMILFGTLLSALVYVNGSLELNPPDCGMVCTSYRAGDESEFHISAWNVTCQDKVCVILAHTYSKFEVPKSSGKNTLTINLDIKLLKLNSVNPDKDTLGMSLSVGFGWEDSNLFMCNCKDQDTEDFTMSMEIEQKIWIPDLVIIPAVKVEREKILNSTGNVYIQHADHRTLVYTNMNLKATLMCSSNPSHYPFDRNRCRAMVESYGHDSKTFQLRSNSFTSSVDKYKKIRINASSLCGEEVANGTNGEEIDGFKVILEREDEETKRLYGFTMALLVLTACLATLLPGNPHKMEVDKSAPIVEVVISAAYILFDLIDVTPTIETGTNMLIKHVSFINYVGNFTLFFYFGTMFLRRFGKVTFKYLNYIWGWCVSRSKGRARLNDAGENGEIEDLTTVIKDLCNLFNKLYFMVVLFICAVYSFYHWEVHNQSINLRNEKPTRACTNSS